MLILLLLLQKREQSLKNTSAGHLLTGHLSTTQLKLGEQ